MVGNYTGIGIKNAIGFKRNLLSGGILSSLKENIIGLYSPKMQKATNYSLSKCPVLLNQAYNTKYSVSNIRDVTSIANSSVKISEYKVVVDEDTKEGEGTWKVKFTLSVATYIKVDIVKLPKVGAINVLDTTTLSETSPATILLTLKESGIYKIPEIDNKNNYTIRSDIGALYSIEFLPMYNIELHNFEFGGLSGIGGYSIDFSLYVPLSDRIEELIHEDHKIVIKGIKADYTACTSNYIPSYKKGSYTTLKVSGIPPGGTLCIPYDGEKATPEQVNINSDGVYTIMLVPTNNDSIYSIGTLNCIGATITIEELPYFPNSLVFNGVSPIYPYNKDNFELKYLQYETSYWVGFNKFKLNTKANGTIPVCSGLTIKGSSTEIVSVKIPPTKIRISGLKDNVYWYIWYKTEPGTLTSSQVTILNGTGNGTFTIPAIELELVPKDTKLGKVAQNLCYYYISINTFVKDTDDITVEFLPNYEENTTANYGTIPDIPLNTVKSVIMDFVPFADKSDSWYYNQRYNTSITNSSFAIINAGTYKEEEQDQSKIIAYKSRTLDNCYIDGVLNTDKTVLYMVQQRQIVGYNCENPNYSQIILGHEQSPNNLYTPQMALNQLILFDRVLTDKEMEQIAKELKKQ